MTTTDVLALYAAMLATATFFWQFFDHWRDRARVVVSTQFTVQYNPVSGHKRELTALKVVNKGRRPVTIVAAGYRMDFKSPSANLSSLDARPIKEFPFELLEGQLRSLDSNREVVDWPSVLYAWAKDGSGKEYRSRKHPFGKSKMSIPGP